MLNRSGARVPHPDLGRTSPPAAHDGRGDDREASARRPRPTPSLAPDRAPRCTLRRSTRLEGTVLPIEGAEGRLHLFHDERGGEHVALVVGDVAGAEGVLTRVHSRCFTGDVFGSRRCDCGAQLHHALGRVAEEGAGVVLYLDQEGRGIGLADKLRAYDLQDTARLDTVDANLALGRDADERRYDAVAAMLSALGVVSVRLLTNNPEKERAVAEAGVQIVRREGMPAFVTPENRSYLDAKVRRMGHDIHLDEPRTDGGE